MSARTAFTFALVANSLLLPACGYRPVAAGVAGGERFSVVLARSNIPDAVASNEVLAGVRDELVWRDALATGDGYPRCEVEVLLADRASEATAAHPNADGRLLPMSRATRVSVVARAWVVPSAGASPLRDTGDMRAFATVAVAADARAEAFQHDDALRAAGRRVGRLLGMRILGLPSSSED